MSRFFHRCVESGLFRAWFRCLGFPVRWSDLGFFPRCDTRHVLRLLVLDCAFAVAAAGFVLQKGGAQVRGELESLRERLELWVGLEELFLVLGCDLSIV